MPVSSGDRTLELLVGKAAQKHKQQIEAGQTTSYLVHKDGTRQEIHGEVRRPTSSFNVQVFYLADADTSPIKIAGPNPAEISPATKEILLPVGDYQVSGTLLKVEANLAYSIVVTKVDGKPKVLVLVNTPTEKPT